MAKYNILTDKLNNYFTNNRITTGSAKPTNGTWGVGDLVIANSITDGVFGWICKQAGTPGTWLPLKSANDINLNWDSITGKPGSFTPAPHNHDDIYFKKTGGTISGDTTFNGNAKFMNGIEVPAHNGTKDFLLSTFKEQDGGTRTYAELVLKNAQDTWEWGKSLKIFNDGTVMLNKLETSGSVYMSHESSLRGFTGNQKESYHIIGVMNDKNISLGWENECYIHVNNTTKFFQDVHLQAGKTIHTPGIRVGAGSGYPSIGLGSNYVRLEYAVPRTPDEAGVAYIAGSETQTNGFGTGFGAKWLESYSNYIKIGGRKLYMQDGDPGGEAGGHSIWIKTA